MLEENVRTLSVAIVKEEDTYEHNVTKTQIGLKNVINGNGTIIEIVGMTGEIILIRDIENNQYI